MPGACSSPTVALMSARAATSGWAGLFDTAFNRSQNPMALTDGERCLVEVNGAFATLLGYRPSQMEGRHLYDFVAEGPLLSTEEWERTLERGVTTGSATLERANGEVVSVQFAVHPEFVTGRRLVLFVALMSSRWGRHFRRVGEHPAGGKPLTAREREVVHLVSLGSTGPEIAAALHISEHTVHRHVTSAMHKLGARSRAQMVAKALGEGILDADRELE
jgi:PAS domain S-box-containing protein